AVRASARARGLPRDRDGARDRAARGRAHGRECRRRIARGGRQPVLDRAPRRARHEELRTARMNPKPSTVLRREDAERELAREIAALVRARPATVLGLAAGDTPTGVYRELARMRREEALDFSRVTAFNLDEYLDLPADHPRKFGRWTRELVVGPLGLRPENAHALPSSLRAEEIPV